MSQRHSLFQDPLPDSTVLFDTSTTQFFQAPSTNNNELSCIKWLSVLLDIEVISPYVSDPVEELVLGITKTFIPANSRISTRTKHTNKNFVSSKLH